MLQLLLICVCFYRRTAYVIALRRNHLCAALLNPSSADPLVWPSPLKIISELNPDVKLLLEKALMEANRKREKKILKGTVYALSSPAHTESMDDDKLEVVFLSSFYVQFLLVKLELLLLVFSCSVW